MSWSLFSSTFAAIFIAEMGDKTQLAAFALAGSGSSRWTVFVAASLALIATTALAILAGGLVGRYIPAIWVKRGAGALFIVMGVVFLLSKAEPPTDTDTDADSTSASDGAAADHTTASDNAE